MEHDLILMLGMLGAFILGAKIQDITFSWKKRTATKQQKEHENRIKTQEQSLSNYSSDKYPRRGGNSDG